MAAETLFSECLLNQIKSYIWTEKTGKRAYCLETLKWRSPEASTLLTVLSNSVMDEI